MNFKNTGMDGQRPPAPLQLARQSSVYSLTFEEFQNQLGASTSKDFGSMNMDELLRNIWNAEENQSMSGALAGSSASPDSLPLQRQGSLTLPRTLSQKTVDEVWRDLVGAAEGLPGAPGDVPQQQQRQPTLGEVTLEEFLVRAGVVREELGPPRIAGSGFFGDLPSGPTFGGSQIGGGSGMKIGGPRPLGGAMGLGMGGGVVGMGHHPMMPRMVGLGGAAVPAPIVSPTSHLQPEGLGKGAGDVSSVSPVPYAFNGGLRGRKPAGIEKVMERRQKRMIKNRESAARSRARKQAYTMELEAEVAQLKEQNKELQAKQAEMMEMQKNQVMEMLKQQPGPKKPCLRRTLTGPW